MQPVPVDDLIGQCFGSYRLKRFIARGSMGEVYEGVHLLLGKRVAVKVASKDVSDSVDGGMRFFNEARVAALMEHAGLTEVYDFGHHDSGRAYIVMELLEGETLEQAVVRSGVLPVRQALRMAKQIAHAMAVAHASGVIHRDLKPDNVVLVDGPDLDAARVKVIDFSVAKVADAGILAGRPSSTQEGEILGTPAFMAPEQCHGAALVDTRADVYSLGCVLFFMLTGRPPFLREGIGPMLSAHLIEAPPAPSSVVPGLPAEIDNLVLSLLAKSPGERPATMEAVHALLVALEQRRARQPIHSGPLLARPFVHTDATPTLVGLEVTTQKTRPMLAERSRLAIGAVGLVLLALAVFGSQATDEALAAGAPEPGSTAALVRDTVHAASRALDMSAAAAHMAAAAEDEGIVIGPAEPGPAKKVVRKGKTARGDDRRAQPEQRAPSSKASRAKRSGPPPRVSVKDGALNPFVD